MYANTEQAAAPTCTVCGRKLGIGYYYSCHICSQNYCYAHAPVKCRHSKLKVPPQRVQVLR